tara:strand:+ start:1551 stop:2270 length:720 start_codon:yes stop_codon:yes gene_type:complete
MATRGQVELARIRNRPIHEQAKQNMAEFNDPFTTAVDLGTNLLEGYKFGQKLIDKKDSLLDREARKTERGDTNEMFKDYDEYKFYQGLTDEAKEVYNNPLRFEKEMDTLESRIPSDAIGLGREAVDAPFINPDTGQFEGYNKKTYLPLAQITGSATNLMDLMGRDVSQRVADLPDYTDPMPEEFRFNLDFRNMDLTMRRILDIGIQQPPRVNMEGIMDESVASYRRSNILLPQGTVVSR